MADEAPEVVVVRPPLWQRIAKWFAIALLGLVALLGAVLFGIDTGPGHRLIADQLGGYTTASGLNIKVGRIDGSIYDKLTLSDVRVADPQGVFATSPKLVLDWRPWAFLRNHVDVHSLTTPLVTLRRAPALKATPPGPANAPILPDIDIDVDRLKVDRLVLAKPVTGDPHLLRLGGQVHIANRRAQLVANAVALRGPGISGGDTLALTLDAVPDDNKLDLDVKLKAPTGGVVAQIASLKAPLALSIGGKGSWADWQGRAIATLGAGQLANLGIHARSGHIEARGFAKPGLYLAGPVDRLTSPRLDVAIDTTLDKRKADTRIKLSSSALAVDAGGIVDLANNQFGNFAVDARLLTPGAILPNLAGKDVLGRFVLNGSFATPTVDYKLSAGAIRFGSLGVDNLYAEGLARVEAARILLPVHARAGQIVGLNAAVGGLASHARIDGDIAVQMPQILSDNLHIRSDNIDATAVVVANVNTGRYTGALKGRINNYRVDSIGIIDLTTDAKLVPGRDGGFGITGRVVAKTQKLFNSGIRDFLGGNAFVRADIGYSPEGILTFSGLRMNAPKFRVTRGEGRFDPAKGTVAISADANSNDYGPITAQVNGTVDNPVVVLHAAHPNVGIGLANLDARVVGRGGAYQVNATGGTDYGPFSADVLVRPSPRLSVDVHKLLFAGVTATGHVAGTAAGPFAGRLQFAGQGLTGSVDLAAQGKYQRADVAARAFNAKVPGLADLSIGRAIVNASVVLLPTAPQIVADVQVGDTRYGNIVIQAARAKVNYVNGHGTAQALLTGSSGVGFRVAVNGQLAPGDYRFVSQGQASGVAFKTSLIRVEDMKGIYRLLPTRIDFGGAAGGSARIAGSFGGGATTAQARLDRLDLSFLSGFMPDLGLAGQATGSVDYRQAGAAMPDATANVTITGFQRIGLAAVSEPVDVVVAGKLSGEGGDVRALIRRGPTAVGRVVATMRPVGAGASWSDRLLHAPLGGGIRYNGPSAVLFSLAALQNQQLTGPIAVAADFSGTATAPRVNGLVRADNLTYDNEAYGTRLSQMRIAGQFSNDRLVLQQLQAKAGDGTVSATGSVGIAADSGYPIDLTVKFDKAQLAKSDALAATSTGQLHITHDRSGGLIQGNIDLPNARYEIIRQGAAEVPELTGVRRKSEIKPAGSAKLPAPEVNSTFALDLHVRAQSQLFVSGMGLESEWSLDMAIGGTTAAPTVSGGLDLVRGTFTFSGKRFDVTKGQIRFRGGALSDPDINIQASTTTSDITAVINITGTGNHPQIAFTSTPVLPQDEVLSRLLFGASPANLSATEAIQLAAALNSLRSSGGGLNPLGKLRSATGFDRLRILGANDQTGQGTSLAAGKYITKNIYVEIITDAKGMTATQIQISLTKALSLLSSAGSFGGSNASLKYSKDY